MTLSIRKTCVLRIDTYVKIIEYYEKKLLFYFKKM